MIKIIFLALLLPQFSFAVEYICWQQAEFPGVAFEASNVRCGNGKKEKGNVADDKTDEKKIVCLVPAMCLALTPDVLNFLYRKANISSVPEIKRLDSKVIQGFFANSKYIGRASQLTCTGQGKMGIDSFGKLGMTESKCPNFSACANADEIYYNMSLSIPETIMPFRQNQGNSPVRSMPNPEAVQ